MNWNQIEGRWHQLKGSVTQSFGRCTSDDLEQIRGQREIFIGKIQERYGLSRAAAHEKADQWLAGVDL